MNMLRVALALWCVLVSPSWGGASHDEDSKKTLISPELKDGHETVPRPSGKRPGGTSSRPKMCSVQPNSLSEFANGEAYDFSQMVEFLTSNQCADIGRSLSGMAMRDGIAFKNYGPVKLDSYAKLVSQSDPESLRRVEMELSKTIPNLLRTSNLTSRELYPLIGQLAVLDPESARKGMAAAIQAELIQADDRVGGQWDTSKRKNQAGVDLSAALIKLGANESLIAFEVADSIEEMALLSQADSLSKMFRALGYVTSLEASLVPTFNLSAEALNRGIQKSKNVYEADSKANLLKTVFWGIRGALSGNPSTESGTLELNEGMGTLLSGAALKATSLKSVWKDVLKILTQTTSQKALGDAVALSLTSDVVYVPAQEMHQIQTACKNYPAITRSLQANFLLAWKTLWEQLEARDVKWSKFNEIKNKTFVPLTTDILAMNTDVIEPVWLREVWRRGLVKDEDIEKRFPKLMLYALEKDDRASTLALKQNDFESSLALLSENLSSLWLLTYVEVPALLEWVGKYDKPEKGEEPRGVANEEEESAEPANSPSPPAQESPTIMSPEGVEYRPKLEP